MAASVFIYRWSVGEVLAGYLSGRMLRTLVRGPSTGTEARHLRRRNTTSYIKVSTVDGRDNQLVGQCRDGNRPEFSVNLIRLFDQVREYEYGGWWKIPTVQRDFFLEPMYRLNVFSFPTPAAADALRQLNQKSYDWIEEIAVTTLSYNPVTSGFAFQLLCNTIAGKRPESLYRIRVTPACVDEYLRYQYDCAERDLFHQFPRIVEVIILRATRVIMAIRNNGWSIAIELDASGMSTEPIWHEHEDGTGHYSHEESTRLIKDYEQSCFQGRYNEVEKLLLGHDMDALSVSEIREIIGMSAGWLEEGQEGAQEILWQQRIHDNFV
ncbi:hypothetical protein BU16DRAFT_532507 [Lophium mytilinum]|uniref:Uncharacterized protein n=1 Tax=Lophium mytilinum TaxID=390894 RepID=A0A6A6REF2_9PEZI|nr:hypothetical protein BU16DRAFT_532507 [Lophium mytilinum]